MVRASSACFTELVEGLQFSAHQGTASLHHVKVGKRGCQQRTLLDLTAPGLPLLQGADGAGRGLCRSAR